MNTISLLVDCIAMFIVTYYGCKVTNVFAAFGAAIVVDVLFSLVVTLLNFLLLWLFKGVSDGVWMVITILSNLIILPLYIIAAVCIGKEWVHSGKFWQTLGCLFPMVK